MTCYASSSRVIRPAASPALLIWMRGSRGWYALQQPGVPLIGRGEMRRWKIAAPLVGLYFAGAAIAGTLPNQTVSGSVAETIESQERHSFQPRDIAEVPLPIASASGAAHEHGNARAFYYRLYYQKRRGVSGGLLAIGSTSDAAPETSKSYESSDPKRRQLSGGLLSIDTTSGAASETSKSYESNNPQRRQLSGVLLSIGTTSGAASETSKSYESYDRKRRQFIAPHLDFSETTPVAEAQFAPRTASASPKHRPHAHASRQSIADPHVSSEQTPDSYSSGSISEISTSSLSKLPPIALEQVTTIESETAESHAGISSSAVPRPIRKPPKPIKFVKTIPAKATLKKVAGRCRNRIWRC